MKYLEMGLVFSLLFSMPSHASIPGSFLLKDLPPGTSLTVLRDFVVPPGTIIFEDANLGGGAIFQYGSIQTAPPYDRNATYCVLYGRQFTGESMTIPSGLTFKLKRTIDGVPSIPGFFIRLVLDREPAIKFFCGKYEIGDGVPMTSVENAKEALGDHFSIELPDEPRQMTK